MLSSTGHTMLCRPICAHQAANPPTLYSASTQMLLDTIRNQAPEYVVMTFDKGRTFRHEPPRLTRPTAHPCPTTCASNSAACASWSRLSVFLLRNLDNYEADDVIGTLVEAG